MNIKSLILLVMMAATVAFARTPDGDSSVKISGELKQWHKVTLTLDGPFASERDTEPNPFTDLAFNITFIHESGSPKYTVPCYFAVDGNAAESSADNGTKCRVYLSPDKPGRWSYAISFIKGPHAIMGSSGQNLKPFDGKTGSFMVTATDKAGRDFRAHGRSKALYPLATSFRVQNDQRWLQESYSRPKWKCSHSE